MWDITTPNNIAVVFEDQSLTYEQLNEEANQLARYIQKQNPGELIAICMDRSLEMMVAILGVFKAGCAYVPIDPNYPVVRIDYILKDTQASLMIDKSLKNKPYKNESKRNLRFLSGANDLAYIIYTSGTTGNPKGVMIAHRSLVNMALSRREQFSLLSAHEKIAQICAITFDTSCLDYALAWINGYELHVLSSQTRRDVDLILDYITRNSITYVHMPTALYNSFERDALRRFDSLKYLVLGGEKLHAVLNPADVNYIQVNSYGPTETTVESSHTMYLNNASTLQLNPDNIGRAVGNTQLYVLDGLHSPIPVGAIGELYIGGAGLARGYLNQPELTAARFITNPFGEGRLYKTGDLVRWLPDGTLEYIGRNDSQVKIRGYRIELGEIESVLSSHPDIKQCVVELYDAKLIAYYVGQTKNNLNDYLSLILPEYMIPSAFIALESFPLTSNDKLDRKAFPQPDFTQNPQQYVAPRSPFEHMMVKIWQSFLNIETIGVHDDFFKLGGHSILAIQVVAQMNKKLQRYGYRLSIADVFTHKCIAMLSEKLLGESRGLSVVKLMNEGPLNKKIHFFHAAFGGCEAYQKIADELAGHYHAIGIDNVCLYYDITINNLTELTRYYLEKIESTHPFDTEIILCGWSLGGNIALEMAYQLEQLGKNNIKIILLDTGLNLDSSIRKISNKAKLDEKNRLKKAGAPGDYIKRRLKMMDIAGQLQNNLTNRLSHSEIVLFKADKKGLVLAPGEQADFILREDNNIKCIADKPIKIIKIDTTHEEIITYTKEITAHLLGG